MDPTGNLPRSWWFPSLRGLRPAGLGTYGSFALDDQPPVPDLADLVWLDAASDASEWPIDTDEAAPQTRLTTHGLHSLGIPVRLPVSLTTLAARSDFRGRIRSATACYLDLGDFAVPTVGGGFLVHLLSDQQWVRHWLLYVDADGNEAVVTTPVPFGFHLAPDEAASLPDEVPLDGSFELEVCADTLAEFLFRFWIENELWWALQEGGELPPHLVAYAGLLAEATAAPF